MSHDDILKTIPVILMTASVNLEPSGKYSNLIQYVTKPASVSIILDALKAALS